VLTLRLVVQLLDELLHDACSANCAVLRPHGFLVLSGVKCFQFDGIDGIIASLLVCDRILIIGQY